MTRQRQQVSQEGLMRLMGPKASVVLSQLGYDLPPTDHNPIWLALAGLNPLDPADLQESIDAGELSEGEAAGMQRAADRGVDLADKLRRVMWKGSTPNKVAIMTAYAACQAAFYPSVGGPLGDNSLGTIRQSWYFSKSPEGMGFKFAAQLLEQHLIRSADIVIVDDARAMDKARSIRHGNRVPNIQTVYYKTEWKDIKKEMMQDFKVERKRPMRIATWPRSGWGRAYAQLQSSILADFVRDGATYDALFVEDASRPIESASPLLKNYFFVLLLEKEGLVPHFKNFCKRAGIQILVGAGGNMAFSAIEQILNSHFMHMDYERSGMYMPTAENPLHLLSLTDHDYFGLVPVEAGAVTQFERYLPGAVELHRVGIMPEQLVENGRSYAGAGFEFDAWDNSSAVAWTMEHGREFGGIWYTLEVEALTPEQYLPTIIKSIVEIVGGDEELGKALADLAEPNHWEVVNGLNEDMYSASWLYQAAATLQSVAYRLRWKAETAINQEVAEWVGEESDDDAWWNDPDVRERIAEVVEEEIGEIGADSLIEHTKGGHDLYRPVDNEAANTAMTEMAQEHLADDAVEFLEDRFQLEYDDLWKVRFALRQLDEMRGDTLSVKELDW